MTSRKSFPAPPGGAHGTQCACGASIPLNRINSGFYVCKDCGEAEARRRTEALKRSLAPAFNKGAYQPMMSRQDALDAGRK